MTSLNLMSRSDFKPRVLINKGKPVQAYQLLPQPQLRLNLQPNFQPQPPQLSQPSQQGLTPIVAYLLEKQSSMVLLIKSLQETQLQLRMQVMDMQKESLMKERGALQKRKFSEASFYSDDKEAFVDKENQLRKSSMSSVSSESSVSSKPSKPKQKKRGPKFGYLYIFVIQSRRKTNTVCGHFGKDHYAKGMCNYCYHRKGNEKKPWLCGHARHYAKGLCQRCYANRNNLVRDNLQ